MNKEDLSIEYSTMTESQLQAIVENNEIALEFRENALNELAIRSTKASNLGALFLLIDIAKKISNNNKLGLARILRKLLDTVSENDNSLKSAELAVCKECLQWANQENKTFLRQKLELRLATIYFKRGEIKLANDVLLPILNEAKKIDDKQLLIEGHLLEAKLLYLTKNWPRAKAALTACRTAAHTVYVGALLLADIETTAGMIHLSEKDPQVAFSYFYEGLEAYHQNGQTLFATANFQYILLAKIMQGSIDEAKSLIDGRFGQLYSGKGPIGQVMVEVLKAYSSKDLPKLNSVLIERKRDIETDPVIGPQIEALIDQLLEQNILKLVYPYSKVEISYLSKKLLVSESIVESKICGMILDEKLKGSIDQDSGVLEILDNNNSSDILQLSSQIISNLKETTEVLFERASKIHCS